MKIFRKSATMARADAPAKEFQNRLAGGLKKAEDLLNARAAQIWEAEQSKVSHDVSKAKFRIPFSLRFSAEEGDFELKLQFISPSGRHGIPAKTMDGATMGKVVRIIKSSLGASSMNVSPLRISSGGTGGAPTIGFLTLKGKVATARADMAMSKQAISQISLLKGTDTLLGSHYKKLESAYKDIQNFMDIVHTQITEWNKFKGVFVGTKGEKVEMDIASIDARIADLEDLYKQLKNVLSRVNTALNQKTALPQKLKEFTNTIAKFSK